MIVTQGFGSGTGGGIVTKGYGGGLLMKAIFLVSAIKRAIKQ